MRITWSLAKTMMFAMYGHPFSGDHTRGQPQPETHGMTDPRAQLQSQVCLMAMQVNGYAHYGHVGHEQREDDF